jgi:hypothetical protein
MCKVENTKKLDLTYDCFKHITTISTGSLLLIVAFMEKIFSNPEWKFMAAVSILAFTISVVSNLVVMFIMVTNVKYFLGTTKSNETTVVVAFGVAFLSMGGFFILGIVSFIIFAFKNLF